MPLERVAGELVLDGIRVNAEVEHFVAQEDARLKELVEKSVARNTQRAYASDWDSFCGWCFERGFAALPAQPDTIARYLRWLIDHPELAVDDSYVRADGRAIVRRRLQRRTGTATLRRHLVSIGKAHVAAGYDDATKSVYVKTVWAGIRKERGTAPRKKDDLNRERLISVLAAFAPPDIATLDGSAAMRARRYAALRLGYLRDRAIILLGWSGAFRRSEMAAIEVEHIRREAEGLEITLPFSKTNQDGQHERVLIAFAKDESLCAIRALDAWLVASSEASDEPPCGPVFRRLDRHGHVLGRIQPAVVATITKRFAKAAELDERLFAAHSLRSGWITTAANEERLERDMMRHSRHRSVLVLRGYIREGAKWKNHPGLDLL